MAGLLNGVPGCPVCAAKRAPLPPCVQSTRLGRCYLLLEAKESRSEGSHGADRKADDGQGHPARSFHSSCCVISLPISTASMSVVRGAGRRHGRSELPSRRGSVSFPPVTQRHG